MNQYEILNHPRDNVGRFVLGGCGGGVELFVDRQYQTFLQNAGGGTPVNQVGTLLDNDTMPSLDTPANSMFDGSWLQGAEASYTTPPITARPRTGPMTTSYGLYGTLQSEETLITADYYRLITPHQTPTFDSTLPFFYRDTAREYFIVPTNYYKNGNYYTTTAPQYVYDPYFRVEYTFWTFYHPWACLLVSQLNSSEGVDALYAQPVQLDPASVAGVTTPFDFKSYYLPDPLVLTPYPTEDMDFGSPPGSSPFSTYSIYNTPYAIYNWELFFHVPFLIANALSTNQQFQLAKHWYEYVFNPTGSAANPDPTTPQQRYWITKPFNATTSANYATEQLVALMNLINQHDTTLEHQVAAWRQDPFDPDAIAQMRPVAYQRAFVMAYIDNLIAWGDQLFTQDTRETINLATQMYVLADELLGPKPEVVPPLVAPVVQNYSQLVAAGLDAFSNATVAAENAIPPVTVNVPTRGNTPGLPSLTTLYFAIPSNTQLLGYWDTVADRLFKIRHCMNIQGIVQQLPLFSAPINPALLVAAAAAGGLDLSSVLSDANAAGPPYRFRMILRHAIELCEQVRSLGAQLLSALEKSDAEAIAQIRSSGEINLQTAIDDIRNRQIDAANQQITVLAKTKQAFQDRANFYMNRPLMNDWEQAAQALRATVPTLQETASLAQAGAAVAHAAPNIEAGAAGSMGSPTAGATIGGSNAGNAAQSAAVVTTLLATMAQTGAELSSTLGNFHQRQDAWTLEGKVAQDEMARIDSETDAAKIRIDIANLEKAAQDIAVTNAQNVDDYLHGKFTNQELYDWMVGQTSTTYFQAYQLAYAMAKAAEKCFDRELAIFDTTYIQFGYWDSLRQGLTAGEQLHYDLRRMESAYYTQNDRELEITKHVSLVQLDPYALVELRETGSCLITLPEILFDLDNPGHYMRRLKTVSLTMAGVPGPYTSVAATLTLLTNQIRTSTSTDATTHKGGYLRDPAPTTDNRFIDDPGGTDQIVTSSAVNDSGLFELRFEDERYLPFESAGAISTWKLSLNSVYPQFDYTTITDVVMHLRYTARDGGALLAKAAHDAAMAQLNTFALEESRKGLYRLFSGRHEYTTCWAQFLDPAPGADQILTVATPPERFPFYTRGLKLTVSSVDVFTNTIDSGDYNLELTTPAGVTQTVTMRAEPMLNGVHHIQIALSPHVNLGSAPTPPNTTPPTWTIKVKQASATDYRSLTAGQLDDILLIFAYEATK
jgi:hypothetical protein